MEKVAMDETEAIDAYIATMTDYDRIAYKIAIKQLESSFDIVKSIGFQEYLSKNNIVLKK